MTGERLTLAEVERLIDSDSRAMRRDRSTNPQALRDLKHAMNVLENLHKGCWRCEPLNRFRLAARAAADYIAECVNAENPGQVEVTEVVIEDSKGVPS